MEQVSSRKLPTYPKLRPVQPQLVEYQAAPYIYLRDPMGLANQAVLVPQQLGQLLALCDGTRDLAGLRTALLLRTGQALSSSDLEELLAQLDTALLLENGTYKNALDQLLTEYRQAPCRPPSHAGIVYPSEADALSATLQDYCNKTPEDAGGETARRTLTGVISPHIDYTRGHETYARLWQRAAPALTDVELVLVFGADHNGGPGMLTLTRQDYATPLGVLPTQQDIVRRLAEVIGPEKAFQEEVHHVGEHSIELALVWLHYFLRGRSVPIVPILCGSFQHFMMGEKSLKDDEVIGGAISFLREATAGRRTMVVAAADLAHVGPAFGDPAPLDAVGRARLAAADQESLAAICGGDASAFFQCSVQEADARRLCGLPPIYMALRYLENARGTSMGYAQCPADAGGSLVSIAGVLLSTGA